MELGIITDSSSDLSLALADEWGVGVVPIYVHLDGQKYRDGKDLSAEKLYRAMHAGLHPSTEPPSVQDFATLYERYLQHYDQLLSIHLSGELSLTAQNAEEATRQLGTNRIRVIDTKLVSGGLGAVVLRAAELLREGAEEAQILAEVLRMQQSGAIFFSVADLSSLVRGGRLPKAGEVIGNWLGLRPVLTMEKGRIRLQRPVRQDHVPAAMAQAVTDVLKGQRIRVTIAHAEAEESWVEGVKQMLQQKTVLQKGRITRMGPVVAAHTGLGTLGVYAYPV